MDLFEQLRREHEFGIGTIAGVAAKFGVHRRVVRQAIGSALPPKHHYPPRIKPKLGAVAAFIDKVLDEDRDAPRKQRHTARRLYRRILTEFPDATVIAASRVDIGRCAGSRAARPLHAFVEASTNCETSSARVQIVTNMFLPTTAAFTSSPVPSR